MTVGDRIKARREALNLSQGDIATAMGITRQAVSKAELHDSNITMDKVQKFAEALDCDASYLMGWQDTPRKPINRDNLEEELRDVYIQQDKNRKLLNAFNQLDEEGKKQIINMIAFLLSQGK